MSTTLSADVLSQSTLQCHGMSNELLQVVYNSVILSKLLHVTSAWWGFTNVADCQPIEAFVCHVVWSGFYSADSPTVAELVSDTDDKLFENVLNNENHVLQKLLPEWSTHNMRPRSHTMRPRSHTMRPRSHTMRLRSHNHSLCLRNDSKNCQRDWTRNQCIMVAQLYTGQSPLLVAYLVPTMQRVPGGGAPPPVYTAAATKKR